MANVTFSCHSFSSLWTVCNMLHWLFVGQSHLTNYIGGRIDFTLYDVRIAQRNRCCLSSSFYSTSIFGWHCVLLAQLFKPASLANGNTVTHLTLSSPRAAVEGPHNRSPLLRDRELLAITSCVVSTGQLLKWFRKESFCLRELFDVLSIGP